MLGLKTGDRCKESQKNNRFESFFQIHEGKNEFNQKEKVNKKNLGENELK